MFTAAISLSIRLERRPKRSIRTNRTHWRLVLRSYVHVKNWLIIDFVCASHIVLSSAFSNDQSNGVFSESTFHTFHSLLLANLKSTRKWIVVQSNSEQINVWVVTLYYTVFSVHLQRIYSIWTETRKWWKSLLSSDYAMRGIGCLFWDVNELDQTFVAHV